MTHDAELSIAVGPLSHGGGVLDLALHRKRLCMVAVTRGMQFDFGDLEKPEPQERKLREVLDAVSEDDPCWSSFDYLKRHQEKHAVRQAGKGSGFAMQVFSEDSRFIGTITKGYSKVRSTDPKKCSPVRQ